MKQNISALPGYPPDPVSYPLFVRAASACCTLRPGEALYIPHRWWHWVTSYERNIALNFWHAPMHELRPNNIVSHLEDAAVVPLIEETADFAETWFLRKQPVVIRSLAISRWPAFARWHDDYLIERAGTERHAVGISPDPQLFPVHGPHRTRGELMTLDAFVTAARVADERMYLAQNEVLPRQLADDFSRPAFWSACFNDERFRVALWLTFGGADGVTSALHFDYYENLLVQIAGTKRVLMFAPEQTPYLYPMNAEAIRI
jgi:Cupin-like domain